MPDSQGILTSPTPRKLSALKVPVLQPASSGQGQGARGGAARPQIASTPLSATETVNANEVWDAYVKTLYVTQLNELEQLLYSLQVPLQPISRRVVEEVFTATKGRFSSRDFLLLLERLKTLHAKWLHKLRGKALDDDLLEAFVAVGGGADSNGEVDIAKMRAVVGEFHLQVDLDRIIADMDSDGSANIDFGEFASLIRDTRAQQSSGTDRHGKKQSKLSSPSPRRDDDDADEEGEDAFSIEGLSSEIGSPTSNGGPHAAPPITLSSMLYVDEDDDQLLLFPPLGLTSRKDPGELSTRRKPTMTTSDVILTHRKRPAGGAGSDSQLSSSRVEGGELSRSNGAQGTGKKGLYGEGKPKGGRLSPMASRSKPGNSGTGGSGVTAYYKGGGGLRNMTPTPLSSNHAHQGGQPRRAVSVMDGPTEVSAPAGDHHGGGVDPAGSSTSSSTIKAARRLPPRRHKYAT